MSQILVYVDKGVDGGGLKQLICSLKQEVDLSIHTISRIDAKDMIHTDWEKETQLLIIPGGRDCYYHASLNGVGTDKIRSFVRKGGGYLGICAGAYFAASSIEFEKGGALEVCGQRSLKFYPGVATGPVYGNDRYSYASRKGAEAARISWGEESCHIYFNGGCTFERGNLLEGMTMSRYLDIEGYPPAIIFLPIGKGSAVLSGVHVEYSALLSQLEDPHLVKIWPLLKQAEERRRNIFRQILKKHRVNMR